MNSFEKLESTLKSKMTDSPKRSFYLGVWAGVYIALGGTFYSIITSMPGNATLIRFFGALAFTVGLNLVVFKKAQLFTGNNLMMVGLFNKKTPVSDILKNWFFVYTGNLVGSLISVIVLYLYFSNFDLLGDHLSAIASKKVGYDATTAFTKAIYCNMLVCIAIWFAITCETLKGKIIGIIIPITTFVFLGFEHSIANMFFIPLGLSFSANSMAQSLSLFIGNIIPVTLGNIVGGLLVSALIFSFYLKSTLTTR